MLAENTANIQNFRAELLNYCRALTGSHWEGEDLAHETLLRGLFTFGPNDPFQLKAYLFRIAKNAWIDQCRKQKFDLESMQEQDIIAQPEIDPLDIEDAMLVLLQHLSPLQRAVLLFRDVLGYNASEAADMLGTTEGAVKSALHRARRTLKSLREKQADESVYLADVESQREVLKAYLSAFMRYDVQALLALALAEAIDPVQATSTVVTFAQSGAQHQLKSSQPSNSLFTLMAA